MLTKSRSSLFLIILWVITKDKLSAKNQWLSYKLFHTSIRWALNWSKRHGYTVTLCHWSFTFPNTVLQFLKLPFEYFINSFIHSFLSLNRFCYFHLYILLVHSFYYLLVEFLFILLSKILCTKLFNILNQIFYF